jgi:hypothetical protein
MYHERIFHELGSFLFFSYQKGDESKFTLTVYLIVPFHADLYVALLRLLIRCGSYVDPT